MKRGAVVRPLSHDDLRYFWPAYNMGGVLALPPGLDAEQVLAEVTKSLSRYSEAIAVDAMTPSGMRPVGFVVTVTDGWFTWLPSIRWFPWASTRNKMEASVALAEILRKGRTVVFHVKPEDRSLPKRLTKYGLVNPVGQNRDYYGPGQTAFQYETVLQRASV